MKRNSKRRHPFVVVYGTKDEEGDDVEIFVGMLQSPKCPERFAWYWALKTVRDQLQKYHIPFENWKNYTIYPVHRFNCTQFSLKQNDDERFYDHIHVADFPKEEDEEMIKFYNEVKSKWKPTLH